MANIGFWASHCLKLSLSTCHYVFQSSFVVSLFIVKTERLALSKMWSPGFTFSKGVHMITTSSQDLKIIRKRELVFLRIVTEAAVGFSYPINIFENMIHLYTPMYSAKTLKLRWQIGERRKFAGFGSLCCLSQIFGKVCYFKVFMYI